MWQSRLLALAFLILGLGIGFFVYQSEQDSASRFHFSFGLDLAGGSHLIYRADVFGLPEGDVSASMEALRDVIERRVNIFGVSEPLVQVEQSSFLAGVKEERLIVELPGVTDVEEAVRAIGETPVLEFKLLKEGVTPPGDSQEVTDDLFEATGLTGRFLNRAQLEFGTAAGQVINEPVVRLEFSSEGAQLFAKITRENVGRVLAIFLDGELVSAPVIREEIPSGTAIISGSFTPEEAKLLVRNLNFGALPVPIELVSTQTIGASLGEAALNQGLDAGLIGILLVAIFMIVWYRLPGVIAVLSLSIYALLMLSLFKLIPVTLTAAGVAGFILSLGMAVDANVLIFERMKEELRAGKDTLPALKEGFARAWLSIRDGNVSSILSAIVLFWFGSSLIKGFALTLGIGVLVSMFSAISISRAFLYSFGNHPPRGIARFLFGSGLFR